MPRGASTTIAAPLALVLALAACGTGEEGAHGDPTMSGPAASCEPRCVAKATSCDAIEADARTYCRALCVYGVTEGQARCLEAESCQRLEAALMSFSSEYPCGITIGG